MFGFDDAQDNYNQVQQSDNKAEFSHELIAGAASFAGFKAFEDHQRKEGKPVNHQFAKELLAGFAGAEVDKLAETKGEDYFDREKAKHQAKRNAEDLYDQHYGDQDQYDPQQSEPPRHVREQNWGGDRDMGYGGGDQGYGGGRDQGYGGDQGGYGGDQGGYGGGNQGYGGGDRY